MFADLTVHPDEDAPVETVITGIDLDYATVGPKYGDQVGDIEAALAKEEYGSTARSSTLRVLRLSRRSSRSRRSDSTRATASC